MLSFIFLVLGILLVALAAITWEKLVFSRLLDDPLVGKAASVAAAWLTLSLAFMILNGFEVVGFRPFLLWGIAALPVALWFGLRGHHLRQAQRSTESVASDFE